MVAMHEARTVVIVGAGPIGIACGVEAKRRGIDAVLLEKGCIANSIYAYPPNLVFFSSARQLEIGGVPFVCAGHRPTRAEVLTYYRRVVEHYELDVRSYQRVEDIRTDSDRGHLVQASGDRLYAARYVVLATGCYDHPNLLGVPGEDSSNVSHYAKEGHAFFRQKVTVVGGQNSAVETALDLLKSGAEVTLVHRGASLGDSVKYWLRPEIENRIADGSIRAFFEAQVERIERRKVLIRTKTEECLRLESDFVFILTGYHADFAFLARAGVVLEEDTQRPLHDPATLETNVPGIYVAGTVAGGRETGKLTIETTRYHAQLIFQDIQRKLKALDSH